MVRQLVQSDLWLNNAAPQRTHHNHVIWVWKDFVVPNLWILMAELSVLGGTNLWCYHHPRVAIRTQEHLKTRTKIPAAMGFAYEGSRACVVICKSPWTIPCGIFDIGQPLSKIRSLCLSFFSSRTHDIQPAGACQKLSH